MKNTVAVFVLLLLFICLPNDTFAAQDAQNISDQCSFTNIADKHDIQTLCRSTSYSNSVTMSDKVDYWQIDFNGSSVQGIYIEWINLPGEWTLSLDTGAGFSARDKLSCPGVFLQEYVALPEGVHGVRINRPADFTGDFGMYRMGIYTPGKLPEEVHLWEQTPANAELMVFSAHQDDELLFLGGTIPYYAGQQQLDTVVVYITTSSARRLQEALNGLWVCGVYRYPVFLGMADFSADSLAQAYKIWDSERMLELVTEQLLRYRPQVVVTQDENGEYGHGAHRLMVDILKKAIVNAADSDIVGRSFEGYDTWQVKKCYLHLYKENQLTMNWENIMLERFDGRSAFDVVCEAYAQHTSQLSWTPPPAISGFADCRQFGLYYSAVGEDIKKDDFFENITLRIYNQAPREDVKVPGTERVGASEYIYSMSSQTTGERIYLRYGSIDNITEWYACDSTGALLSPLRRYAEFEDIALEMPAEYPSVVPCVYDSLTLYSYTEDDGNKVLLRYGSCGGEAGWYMTDENGLLLEPAQTAEIERVPIDTDSPGGPPAYTFVIVPAALVICVAAAIVFLKIKRKNGGITDGKA